MYLGNRIGHHEIKLAQYDNFEQIVCVDLSEYRTAKAKEAAMEKGVDHKMQFICTSIDTYEFEPEAFDIVYFHASLHHFENVDRLLSESVRSCLKPHGCVIINEYVGPDRLQLPTHQIKAINKGIQLIPKKFRTRFKSSTLKNKFYGSGYLRMIIADPSECVDSKAILPSLHKHYDVITEKPYGGSLLMHILKDISHHFIVLNPETKAVLDELFILEDTYMNTYSSDFVFGIYQKRM